MRPQTTRRRTKRSTGQDTQRKGWFRHWTAVKHTLVKAVKDKVATDKVVTTVLLTEAIDEATVETREWSTGGS